MILLKSILIITPVLYTLIILIKYCYYFVIELCEFYIYNECQIQFANIFPFLVCLFTLSIFFMTKFICLIYSYLSNLLLLSVLLSTWPF